MSIINIFHLLFVVPLFLYIGLSNKTQSVWVYWTLLLLGSGVLILHGNKVWKALPRPRWVNLFHMLVVAPLLIIIGTYGKYTPSLIYPAFTLLGLSALGYHGLHLM